MLSATTLIGALLLTGCTSTPDSPEEAAEPAAAATTTAAAYPEGFDVADWSSRADLDLSVPSTTVDGWTTADVEALGGALAKWTETAGVSDDMWGADGDRAAMVNLAASSLPADIGSSYRDWQVQDTPENPAGRSGLAFAPGVTVLDSSRYRLDRKFEPATIEAPALRGVLVIRAALHLDEAGEDSWILVQREHELTSTEPSGISESAGSWHYNVRSLSRNTCGLPAGAVRPSETDPWPQAGPAELATVLTRDEPFPDYDAIDEASSGVDMGDFVNTPC